MKNQFLIIAFFLFLGCKDLYEEEIVGIYVPNFSKSEKDMLNLFNDNQAKILPIFKINNLAFSKDNTLTVDLNKATLKYRWAFDGNVDGLIYYDLHDFENNTLLGNIFYSEETGELIFNLFNKKDKSILGNRIVFEKENFESPYF